MLSIRPYVPEDVLTLKLPYKLTRKQREELAVGGNIVGFTVCEDDKPIAVGGVHLLWEGVAECWLLASQNAVEKPVSLARYTKKYFNAIIKLNALKRAQATVFHGDSKALAFAEWLGMENEGLMKKYGPNGEDYFRVARVM